ncbi:LemA family protein [Chitinophaga sp. GCM10012297]|uniref:LemA family protein n=1 Tax=Chitinophaga chungangae TaxID=2821488 RepID=A0ABS3YCJ1_9BACT|nr:LemA family protein [Chitinophaga chungangae]MBO9152185.1 LemA family protein [Chitinophaga chungangae]
MKTGIIVIIVLVLLGFFGCSKYNGLVDKQESVKKSWGNVQNQYQRRSDLIGNLVNTVKGSANFEQETLTKVIEARSKATSVQINADNLTPEKIQQFQQAQGELSGALSRLLVTVEKYPELKTTEQFQTLMAQLEGTENRIAVSRNDYNASVNDYNSSIRRFPGNIIAGLGGFDAKGYFEAAPGSETAPKVDFGTSSTPPPAASSAPATAAPAK